MSQFHAKGLLVVFLLSFGSGVLAQTGTISNPTNGRENNPYSRFGFGELVNGNSTVLKGMGNITSAFHDPYEINTDNPASYSFLQGTTFEMGASASTRTIKGSGLSYTTGTATINYLNIGVPLNKHSGLSFGFKPYSHSYYSLVDTLTGSSNPPSPIGQVARSYNGEGGLNLAYLGAAAKWGEFSIGFNAGYMFGNFRNTTAAVPIDTSILNKAYTTEYTNYTRIGGLYWKAGFMYEHKIDSTPYTITIGGTVSLNQGITEKLNAFQISSYNFGDTLVNDTISKPGEQKGKLKLPLSYSIGVMLSKSDKWRVGLDYVGTQWSGYGSTPDSTMATGIASQSYKISLGGEYTPDVNNIRNYFSRVTYRFGLYYGSDYLKLPDPLNPTNYTQLPCYGITVGGSLPFKRTLGSYPSHLHMSIDVGRLGTTANNLLQQTYVRFSLGVSFSSRWFIPRKYD